MQDSYALGADIVLGRHPEGALEQQLCLIAATSRTKYAAPRVERVDECLRQIRHLGYLQSALCTVNRLVQIAAKIELFAKLGGNGGDVGFALRVICLSARKHRQRPLHPRDSIVVLCFHEVDASEARKKPGSRGGLLRGLAKGDCVFEVPS